MGWFRNRNDDEAAGEDSLAPVFSDGAMVGEEQPSGTDRAVKGSHLGGAYSASIDRRNVSASERETSTAAARSGGTGFWARTKAELKPCQPYFEVKDSTGRVMDVPESFAPASCKAFLWKVAAAALAISTLTYGFIDEDASFYMAYLTNWALAMSCCYFVMSILNTVLASRTPQPDHTVGWRIMLTWILFTIAAHTEVVVVILYWPLIYDDTSDLDYVNIMSHGGVLLLVLIDGFFVNRIPMRWMHWYGMVLPFDALYIIWSVIHSYTDIGNPDNQDNDPTTNDDAIYQDVLEWQDDWRKALFWSVMTMFVLGPAVFLFLWLVSFYGWPLCCGKDKRKYIDSFRDETDDRPTVNDVEEGSIFAKWW